MRDDSENLPHPDDRDRCIAEHALSHAELIERVVDLMIERDSYRTLSQQLLHALHHVTVERDRLRAQRRLDRRAAHDEQLAA